MDINIIQTLARSPTYPPGPWRIDVSNNKIGVDKIDFEKVTFEQNRLVEGTRREGGHNTRRWNVFEFNIRLSRNFKLPDRYVVWWV